MDDVERDNERHRQEEQERRARRHKNRESKSRSGHLSEKERKRREHAQRILGAQQTRKRPPPPPPPGGGGAPSFSSSAPSPSAAAAAGGSSVFQSLFQERAEGFFIDLRFRNAPPRPPVGPTFVGLGLEGELTNKWTKYKARNAVESQYTWKLHPGRDLGVPLAVSAMDYEGCYTDPAKDDAAGGGDGDGAKGRSSKPHIIPALHPDDEALINWKGSLGDTAAEQLQQRQDRARAAARLAVSQGHGAVPTGAAVPGPAAVAGAGGAGGALKLKKHHLQSRILDEATPHFMKKTTYLTNDATSVHQFKSLARTQVERAKDVDKALAETKTKYTEGDIIERGFKDANAWDIIKVENDGPPPRRKRTHPSKPGVHAVWDLPLLPDLLTWGHTYTHVVLDNPPKNISSKSPAKNAKKGDGVVFKAKQLREAIVADVTKHAESARMACTVWAPEDVAKAVSDSESSQQPPAKKAKDGHEYRALQHYDLDVVPLRDPNGPPVQYVWTVDPLRGYAGYHAVGSRVQLSTGRPVILGGGGGGAGEMVTDKGYIFRRAMEGAEKEDLEMKTAAVDVDLAEKHGLEVEEADGGDKVADKEGSREKEGWGRKEAESESESEESEADAF